MNVDNNWQNYAVVEGQAKLLDYHNTDAEELRALLREVFRAAETKTTPTGRSTTGRWCDRMP